MKEELSSEKRKGNQLAGVILDEVNKLEKKESEAAQLELMVKKIVNPGVIKKDDERKRYEDLQQKLIAASKEGNQLAESILSSRNIPGGKAKEGNVEDAKVLSSLHAQLISQTKNGEQFASTLLN